MPPTYRNIARSPKGRRQGQPVILDNFSLGLNTALPQASVSHNEASMLVNFKILQSGVIETREGLTRYTTSVLTNPASYIASFSFDIDQSNFSLFSDTDDREWENSANREWQTDIPASSGIDELIVTQPDNKLYYLSSNKVPVYLATLEGDATIIPAGDKAFLCDGSFLKYFDKNTNTVLLAYDDGTGANGYQHDNTGLTADTQLKLYSGNITKAGIKVTTQYWDSGYTITATKVEVYARKVGAPTGTVGCEIYTNAGVLLATSTTTYEAADIGVTAELLSFVFDSGAMSPSTIYWAVVTFSGGGGLGSEKVTDGAFPAAINWTFGAGWAFDGANFEADATTSNADLEQDVTAVAGESYKVVFTVKNYSVGSVLPGVGGAVGTAVSANGTYTQYIIATGTGNLKFTGTGFTGSIDDVSVKKVEDYIQVECDTVASEGDGKYYNGSWNDDTLKLGLMGLKPGRPPRARFGLIQNTRLFTAGDPYNKGMLWYSNVNTGFDWSTPNGGGWIGVIDNNVSNFPIGAIVSLYGNIYIFGQQSQPYLCVFSGDSVTLADYSIIPLLQGVYSTHRTAKYTGNDCWFCSQNGVNALSGVEQYGDLRIFPKSEAIKDKIADYWQDGESFSGYNEETGQYFLKLPNYARCLVVNTKFPVANGHGNIRYPWTSYIFVKEDLSSATYKWTASGSGTNEYYLELAAGGDPSISEPAYLLLGDSVISEGTAGSLSDHGWDYGDNDTLGYNTVYIRDDSGDPDTTGIKIKTVLDVTAFACYSNTFFIAGDDGYIYKLDATVEKDNLVDVPYILGTKLFESPFNHICLEKYNVSCGTKATAATLDLEIYNSETLIDDLHSSTADTSFTIEIGEDDFNRDLNANYKKFMAVIRNIDLDNEKLRINHINLITRALSR